MTEASLLLTFCLFAVAFGVALGWLLRAKVELATETDPESELRNLRSKQAMYASKIRSLHLELAQLESKLASLKASGVDIGQPVEPVPLDDAAMDARLASIIGSFEDEERAESAREEMFDHPLERWTDSDDEFRSILPTDLMGEQARSLDEPAAATPATQAGDPSGREDSGRDDGEESDEAPTRRYISGDLYERVAAALANEAVDHDGSDAGSDVGSDIGRGDEEDEEAVSPEEEIPAAVGADTGPVADLDDGDQPDEEEPVTEIDVPAPPPEPTVPTLRIVRDRPADEDEDEHAAQATTIDLREPDDLTAIKGVGPRAAEMLVENGISRYSDLADLDADALDELADQLGSFRNKIFQQDWQGQARRLASDRPEISVTGR